MTTVAYIANEFPCAVEPYVIQIVFRRFDLERIFLIQVSELGVVFVTEQRVVVEVQLRIQRVQLSVFGEQKRIDLGERGVGGYFSGVRFDGPGRLDLRAEQVDGVIGVQFLRGGLGAHAGGDVA